jgi:hypothetical protein
MTCADEKLKEKNVVCDRAACKGKWMKQLARQHGLLARRKLDWETRTQKERRQGEDNWGQEGCRCRSLKAAIAGNETVLA